MPTCSLIHFFSYVMDMFFLHCGSERIPNPLKSLLNSWSILLLSITRNLNRPIWAPPDPMSYARRARLNCSTDNMRSQWFYSHLRCHASIAEWDHSAFLQNLLPFKGASINTTHFQVVGHTFICWCFSFLRPRFSNSQRDQGLKAPPFRPCLPSDVRFGATSKISSFPALGLPRATSTSCVVSMDLLQRALTEVLVVPCRLPWPLVQGVSNYCFWFFKDFFLSRYSHGSMTVVYGSDLEH